MPAAKVNIVRKTEISAWVDYMIEQGYDRGSWRKIPESKSVEMHAWRAAETREKESVRKKDWRAPKVGA